MEFTHLKRQEKLFLTFYKIMVAKAYAEGKHSFEEIAQLYGIKALSTVKSWYDIYQSKGEEGLRNMKKQGRPRNSETKSTKIR